MAKANADPRTAKSAIAFMSSVLIRPVYFSSTRREPALGHWANGPIGRPRWEKKSETPDLDWISVHETVDLRCVQSVLNNVSRFSSKGSLGKP